MDAKLEALASTDLFCLLDPRQLELIGSVTDRVTVEAGTTLIRQGQVTTHMSIIIDGEAAVIVDDTTVAELGPGDVAGELSMVDGERASATVQTTATTTIWHVARAGFLPLWSEHDELSTPMLRAVVGRLRATNELVSS